MISGIADKVCTRPRCACTGLVVILTLVVSLTTGFGFRALAQSEGGVWDTPANLSHSWAASSPIVVAQPDGRLRVFWWDRFDGLIMAQGTLGAWTEPVLAPIYVVRTLEQPTPAGENTVTTEIEAMPRIVGDVTGQAHAFWLGEVDEETGARPLLYARMAAASTTWSTATTVAESATGFDVVADASGVLHLAYLRDIHTTSFPIGIYYRRSTNAGISWSASLGLDLSRYYRLVSPTDLHLLLAADNTGSVYLTWDPPHLQHLLLAASSDGGVTWSDPVPVDGATGDVDTRSQRGRVVPVSGGETLLLWTRVRGPMPCEQYQAPVNSLLDGVTEGTQRVLAELKTCPRDEQFLSLGEKRVLMATKGEDGSLALATWNGEQWQQSRPLSLVLNEPESAGQIRLSDVQLVVTSTPPSDQEKAGGKILVAVGTDQNLEVWITSSRIETLESILAPLMPTPTATPRILLPDPTAGNVGVEQPQPANLSHSGAASSPAIVTRPDGSVSAFWWDQFDGLVTADGVLLARSVLSGTQAVSVTVEAWSDAVPVPIVLYETIEGASREDGSAETGTISTPIRVMPRVLADADGQAHAFWLEGADAEAVDRPLMHSVLDVDGTTWTRIEVVAESAVAYDVVVDKAGVLHLVYLRAQHTFDVPSGVYYRRSNDGGKTWGQPTAIHQSLYYRLLSFESAHLRLAADGAGDVYVTWNDPRVDQVWLAGSSNDGTIWGEPVPVGDPSEGSRYGRLFAVPDKAEDEVWLLWEQAGYGDQCVLYQASAPEVLAGTERAGRRVLDELIACPDPRNEQFLSLAEGNVLLVSGSDGDVLTLAVRASSAEPETGGQWSEPRQQSFQFEDPETGVPVYLRDLQAAVVQIVPDQDTSHGGQWANQALIVIGTDGEGDVWVTPSRMGGLGLVFAPSSPWSAPVNISQSPMLPGLPAVATDPEGRVHVLWTESEAPGKPGGALSYTSWDSSAELTTGEKEWMRPVMVLTSPEGGAEEPALAVLGGRLHALWSGGPNGQIWYSRAFLRDAYAASGWDDPQPLPTPFAASGVGSQPHIVASTGAGEILHAVYAVPVNEARGIYYTRSEDGGDHWSPARQVFDAGKAGWTAVDYPRIAVDGQGRLHVVWVHVTLSTDNLSQGIYYACSSDGGETWSEPLQVAEGDYNWPQVIADGLGRVHLLWSEVAGGHAWWHRWLANDLSEPTVPGANWEGWTPADRVPGFRDVPGPVGVAVDSSGVLHLAGLGRDVTGEPALLYVTWGDPTEVVVSAGGDRWGEQQAFRLDQKTGDSGLVLALQPTLHRLDVLFRGEMETEDGTNQADVWHTGREIATTDMDAGPNATGQGTTLPTPVVTPDLTTTPLATFSPEATLSPTPNLNVVPPLGGGGDTSLPLSLLLGSGLAALVVVSVFGVYLLMIKRR